MKLRQFSRYDLAFSANRFYPIELPENVKELLLATFC